MTGLDTNILIDLMVSSSDFHQQTKEGIENLSDNYCTTPTNIGECLRILTHPKVFPSHMSLSDACKLLNSLLDYYNIQQLDEPIEWWHSLPDLAVFIPDLKGNEVFDARIALCLKAHNIKRIYTRDSDFLKYRFLQPIYWPHRPR